jgi:hypothetical protein
MQVMKIVAISSILIGLAMASPGRAQDLSPAGSAKAPAKSDNSFWPSPEQESAIPYRPCNTAVELSNGRHVCLNSNRYRY